MKVAPKQRCVTDDKKQKPKYGRWKRKLPKEKEMKQNGFGLPDRKGKRDG